MFCEKCGNQIYENESYCQKCGHKCINTVATPSIVPTVAKNKTNGVTALVIVFAIATLLASVILPFFDVWGGLFPDWDDADTFIDVIEAIGDDFDDIWYRWAPALRMAAFIPSIFLVITALSKSKTGVVLSSGAGIGLLLINLFRVIEDEGIEEVLEFDDCSVSFGFWVALILFVLCFIEVLRPKSNTI